MRRNGTRPGKVPLGPEYEWLRQQGMSIADIAKKRNISEESVYRTIYRYQIASGIQNTGRARRIRGLI